MIDAEVVIVGGGPIGLWTAIQIKTLSGRKVVVLEKHQVYKRSEISLNIYKASLQGVQDKGLKILAKSWGGKQISIKALEDSLEKRAFEVGVHLLKGQEVNPLDLPQLCPNAKLFIGADGAKSRTRERIFGNHFRFNTPLQYTIQVQYAISQSENHNVPSIFKSLYELSEMYQMQKFAEHLIIQNIRPLDERAAKISLQIFVNHSTYKAMANATFATPYYFETDLHKIPDPLKQLLIKWLGSRALMKGEAVLSDRIQSNKMTVIGLGAYATNEVCKVDTEGKVWALVGDAAQGYPYFRAINNGFLLGTSLARSVNKAFAQANDKSLDISAFRSYSRYAYFRATIERIRAFFVNLFINLLSVWIKVSHLVPWQVVKLTQQQKKLAIDKGTEIWKLLCK